jgi:hypothetical protein
MRRACTLQRNRVGRCRVASPGIADETVAVRLNLQISIKAGNAPTGPAAPHNLLNVNSEQWTVWHKLTELLHLVNRIEKVTESFTTFKPLNRNSSEYQHHYSNRTFICNGSKTCLCLTPKFLLLECHVCPKFCS